MLSRTHHKRRPRKKPWNRPKPRTPSKHRSVDHLSRSASRESHQWYRLIVNNVRDFAIFTTDVNGKIKSWNPGAERFFGFTAREIIGKPMDILYVPEDRTAGVARHERSIAVEKGSSEDERWHLRKDGTRFFVFGRVNAMYTDQGQLCGFIKIARDITDRKELQKQLDSSEELHRLILENIQDFAIFTIDPSAKIESWNTGAEHTYGYTKNEIIGHSLAILYTPEDRAEGEPYKTLAATLNEGVSTEEHWCVRKDGRRIFTTGVLRPIRDANGSLRGFSKVARDITSDKLAQEQLERARAELERVVAQRTSSLTDAVHELETFSYSVSHDMRAPLRAMQGFAEVVLTRYAESLPEEGKDLLQRIASAAQRLDLLIKESLNYYRAPHEPLPLQPTDVESILDTFSAEHPSAFGTETLTIERPLLRVMAHPPSLSQALANLLRNAVRFVPPDRKPQVRVSTQLVDGQVRICVQDNGIGIVPEDQEKIWRLFTRLHPEQFEGTGIGLTLVRKAIERMGGKAGVESQEGKGSNFWLQLPASV